MKRIITPGLAIATIACIQAAPLEPVKMKVSDNHLKQQSGQSLRLKTLHEDVLMNTDNGKAISRNETLSILSINATGTMRKAENATKKNGYILYEDFSGWDGNTAKWIPEGWSLEHRGKCKEEFTWIPITPNEYYPAPIEGSHYYTITDDTDQDEWLISPQFVAEEDMILSYYMRLNPMWYYDTKNIDWIKKEYVGDKIQMYTFQILIQEGDGEWELLRDYAEEYKDYTFKEISAVGNDISLTKQTIDLSEYVGKNMKVAFRYLGSDGDTMILDAIGVGYPTLDDVWYMQPANSLYWGYYYGNDPNMYFYQMPVDIATYPVNSPIIWNNMSEEAATYEWEYSDQDGKRELTSTDQNELSATYAPGPGNSTPKLYQFPVLNATAHHRADATYTSPVEYFTAGGSAHYPTPYGECDFTLLPFPLINQDVDVTDVRFDKLGVWSVPVFGHSEYSDAYWLDYCLNGEEPVEGDYAHLTGIGNVFFASEDTPLVVNGMHVYGWGRIYNEAELTATIYALDSEMHTDYDTFTVVARATVKGDAVKTMWADGSKDYLFIPFEFDQPAIVQASEEHPAFVFMLEGFNSDPVDYFTPLHSKYPINNGYCAGYILSEINLQGHIDRGAYKSFKPMQYKEGNVYKDHAGSFAIGLIAEYPWLTTETEEIELTSEESETTIRLNSYHEADKLSVKCPDGIAASISGRYDNCELTVWKKDLENDLEGAIEITGPGVALSIPVKSHSTDAVSSVTSDESIEAIYDLSGRKVASTTSAGVYIVKHANGNISKFTTR